MPKSIQKQIKAIKENWLLLGIAIILMLVLSGVNPVGGGASFGKATSLAGYDSAPEMAVMGRAYYPDEGGFAPDVVERIITKSSYLSTKVGNGEFKGESARVKSIISSSDAFLLNEDVRKNGEGRRAYYTGRYQIKVDTAKYGDVVLQLRAIGEEDSFTENMDDITERYTDLELELEVEGERLERYQSMYKEAALVEDKIELNDRIFNQERRIKYLTEALEGMGQRVDYSTISLTLTEEQSYFSGLSELKELVRSMIGSLNSLVNFIFVLVPWVLAALVLWLAYTKVKK